MFTHEPIIKLNDGRLDYENERRIVHSWFDYCGFKYEKVVFGRSEGFYFLNNGRKNKKVYLCCTRDLGDRNIGKFWFGFSQTHISGNADTGIIFILVWNDGVREYLVLNNYEVLIWRNKWYLKDGKYSVDLFINKGKYEMKGYQRSNLNFRFALNNILLLFE